MLGEVDCPGRIGGIGYDSCKLRGLTEQVIDHVDDGFRATEGLGKLDDGILAMFFARLVFPLTQELRVAPSPPVEALLGVADEVGRRPFFLTLGAFREVVAQYFPLAAAGVLEFVEKPMTELAVEPVFEVELLFFGQAEQQVDVIAEAKLP